MPQADFAYAPAEDAAGLPLAVSIFADRAHIRDEIRDDASAAGLRVRECGDVAALLEGEARPLGELVFIDCPTVDAGIVAALHRLDLRAARAGTHVVIATGLAALEDVFACCDRSAPQILVDPTPAERVIALGRVLAKAPSLRLRELAEVDRLTLLRLTEQVAQIAQRLERIDESPAGIYGDGAVFRFESPTPGYRTPKTQGDGDGLVRAQRPPLPDPRLVRRIIRQRQLRARFFDGALFADPAWDILLDLTAARAEHIRVSVTSLCIASGVPPTTALRWIGQMSEAGLLQRVVDDTARRRACVALTDRAAVAMARYFAEIGRSAARGA